MAKMGSRKHLKTYKAPKTWYWLNSGGNIVYNHKCSLQKKIL